MNEFDDDAAAIRSAIDRGDDGGLDTAGFSTMRHCFKPLGSASGMSTLAPRRNDRQHVSKV
jgi:hypothetical protein